MSRDYDRRSRSRSRDRQSARRNEDRSERSTRDHGRVCSHDTVSRTLSQDSYRRNETDLAGSVSWSEKFKANRSSSKTQDDDLADEFGYSTAGWDHNRGGSIVSMNQWGGSTSGVTRESSTPAPAPPAPTEPAMSESEQWGYSSRPHAPPPMPLSMPLLANPVAQAPPPPPPASQPSGAHIVLENVPADLNIMSLIYEHFKQFGEVVTVHSIPKQNKALIDFRSKEVADAAAAEQVLGVPSIKASVFLGPARGIGRVVPPPPPPAKASIPGQGSVSAPGLTKNLVFESEAARRAREKREQQAEMDRKRHELLTAYTEHIKQIVAKLADKTLKEDVRAKYQEMLEMIKSKISDLQKVETERRRKEAEATQRAMALRYKAFEKQARMDSNKRQQELTLDLRSRCVRISDLPEELAQSVVLVEYLRAMGMKELSDVIWLDNRTSAVLRFQNHSAADQLVKHELAFKAEWVSNEEASGLANVHPVEAAEIVPLDEEEEAALTLAGEATE